jgi:hypothetical protein
VEAGKDDLMNNLLKRIENIETVIFKQQRQREENNKNLYARITDNTAVIHHGAKRHTITDETPLDAVRGVEDYILKAKPEKVTISTPLSGVCDLIPELAESEAGREIDLYYVFTGSISGDYYRLMESNIDITLANIILCEALIPYLRRTLSYEEMGIEHFYTDDVLSLAHSLGAIAYVLADRVKKFKDYRAAYENDPAKYRHNAKPQLPTNRWSRYWPKEA